MDKYWALDYVSDLECELVCDDQLYASKEDAIKARLSTSRPDLFEVNWYTLGDLREMYNDEIFITSDLRVAPCWSQ